MKKGFTLIELLIVTAIIAILATIAVPMFRQYIERTEDVAARTILQHIALAEISHSTDVTVAGVGGGNFIYVPLGAAGIGGVNQLASYGFRPNPKVGFVVLPNKPGFLPGFVAFAATGVEGAKVFAYDSQHMAIASTMDNDVNAKLTADLPTTLTRYEWGATGAVVHSTINIDTTTYRVIR